jgi:exopolyphosphatase/guanosine-5'-triphosphate,3'-diphosphate pyrophosphatase
VPLEVRSRPAVAVGVGGTATQLASVDLGLPVHDRERVEGHAVPLARLEELRDRLAALALAERRGVRGLDPARAPTIVAGSVILHEALGAFALDGFEASERDILWGVALDRAAAA